MNFRHNEQIRISPVFLINEKEEKIGSVPTNEALRAAREAGLDLVEVAPHARPPVVRIMDYGKWRYQQQKKEDKSRAASRAGQLKEIKFRTVRIGDHDIDIKVNHARDFLEEGHKVQFTLQFRGREMAHQELGRELFRKVKEGLVGVSKVERDARMEGRRMTMVLQPETKTKPQAKGGDGARAGQARPQGQSAPAGEKLNIPQPQAAQPPTMAEST
jgi:translation initiation factor IF-3